MGPKKSKLEEAQGKFSCWWNIRNQALFRMSMLVNKERNKIKEAFDHAEVKLEMFTNSFANKVNAFFDEYIGLVVTCWILFSLVIVLLIQIQK